MSIVSSMCRVLCVVVDCSSPDWKWWTWMFNVNVRRMWNEWRSMKVWDEKHQHKHTIVTSTNPNPNTRSYLWSDGGWLFIKGARVLFFVVTVDTTRLHVEQSCQLFSKIRIETLPLERTIQTRTKRSRFVQLVVVINYIVHSMQTKA